MQYGSEGTLLPQNPIKKHICFLFVFCVIFSLYMCVCILWSRVHFGSLCCMRYWFGLERLVYKNVFFLNIEQFQSYLTFYPQKSNTAPLKSFENTSWNSLQRVSKKAKFCTGFKKVHYSYAKKCPSSLKNQFFCNFFCLLLNTRVQHLFETSAKLRFFWYPLQTISKNFLKLS